MKKPSPRRKASARTSTGGKTAAAKAGAGKTAASASTRAKAGQGIDPDLVEALAAIIAKHDLTEVEAEHGGLHIRVARQPTHAPAAVTLLPSPPATTVNVSPIAAPAAALAPAEEHPGAIKSPMVGTAYLRASPEAKPFVEVGSTVKTGDKLLLVEAMKTFNEIVAPRGGTVTAILVDDGKPVEYGEPLLVIE